MPPSRIWHALFLSCRDVLYRLPFFQRFSNRSAATVDTSHLHVGIIYVTCNSPAELFHACRHVYTLHLFRVCVTSWGGKRVVRLSNTSSSLLPSSYRLDLLDFLTHSFYKHRPAFQSTLLHVTKFSKILIFELISPLREGWRETPSASYPLLIETSIAKPELSIPSTVSNWPFHSTWILDFVQLTYTAYTSSIRLTFEYFATSRH